MGLLRKSSAEKAVAFQALFVMGSGIIGASHHYWWVGQPDIWIPFGSVFSTLELIPLILILFEAMGQYRALATSDESFPYTLPFMFIIASGFWNFLGAGVLGFFINLPLVNYYEHGTYLTVGHAHAAMFSAFGFLALGMATYMLRISTKPSEWTERRLRWAFWLWNVGLAVMVFVSVLPVGVLQLETAFTQSYAAARSLAFYNSDLVQFLFWVRLPGAHQVQFISAVTGGPVEYSGDDMRDAHRRMGITDTEFDVVAEHLDTALAENGVSDEDRELVLGTVEELRLEIVETTESGETSSATS